MLLDAVNSIYSGGIDPSAHVQVIVVDNNSPDGSAEALAERFPQATLIANRENIGYAGGNNQAIKVAKAPYILLLNPDVLIPSGGLDRALKFMDEHAEAGALGVRQVHTDGKLQASVRGFPSPLSIFWELLALARLFPQSRLFGAYRMTWFNYNAVAEVDQPMGTFLLIRKTVMDEIGSLDERFPIFFNEVDWCLRCKRAGWKIFFDPAVEIVHYGGASTAQVGAAMAWESRRGLLAFYRKHYSAWKYAPLRAMISVVSWPHAWLQARKRS